MSVLLAIIITLVNLLSILIIVSSILSWFLAPYHPVREIFDRILQPLYAPIRRVIPPMGTMDFTPLVLLLLVQVVGQIASSLLR
jgi:YggT family protein